MALTIPTTMDEVTPAWLTAALREGGAIKNATVTAIEKETIGVGVGILGDLARMTMTYDRDEPGAPKTIVAKLPTQDPAGRGIAQMLGFYEKEARIYHELADVLNTPCSYYSARDPEAVQYVILMEDVGALRMGDQVAGASVDDADLLIREVANWHCQWWESAELEALDWIPAPGAPQLKLAQTSAMMSIEPFLQNFGNRLDERQRGIVAAMAPRMMAMQDAFSDRPYTLCHGDLRLDNIFFGSVDGSRPLTLIDWQIAVKARGAYDMAYFLSQSIDPKERKANEKDWLRHYYDTVMDGRGGYSWEECWHDYRAATLYCVAYPLVGGGSIDLGNERGVELVGQMALRSLTAVTDLDADELLPLYEERSPIIPA
jgi:hypothetical protein